MKSTVIFTCQQCGHERAKWYGKCPECGEWNTFVESIKENSKVKSQKSKPYLKDQKETKPQR